MEARKDESVVLSGLTQEAIDNIAGVLGCTSAEIRDVYPLKQGLTNDSYHFATDAGEFVYRQPGIGTELLIDRAAEAAALRIAKDLGIDDTFVFADPREGWKISRFIPNAVTLDPHDAAQRARAMVMAAKLHSTDIVTEREFDFYAEGKRYESVLLERGDIDAPGYWEMSEKAGLLRAYAAADGAPKCLCHNDLFCLNFLVDASDKLYLIDWEYAGMSDYANDFGTFTVCCELDHEEALAALDAYFGRPATFDEMRHSFAFVALAGWCWYVWSLVKEAEGDCVGEWLEIYRSYAEKYMDRVIGWYAEGDKTQDEGFDS